MAKDKISDGPNPMVCVGHDLLSSFEKHFADISNLANAQKDIIMETRTLSSVQTRLADGVESLSDNLDRGFKMGEKVVFLFGKIVFVFLAVVIVLGLVIVWIARLDVNFNGGTGSIGQRVTETREVVKQSIVDPDEPIIQKKKPSQK